MLGSLNKIHSTPPDQGIAQFGENVVIVTSNLSPVQSLILESVTQALHGCQDTSAAIAALIPPNQFWKWKDMWSISLRNAVYATTMVGYLKNGKLLTLVEVSETLGSMSHP